MYKTLVVKNTHNVKQWSFAVDNNDYDRIIFIGAIFDLRKGSLQECVDVCKAIIKLRSQQYSKVAAVMSQCEAQYKYDGFCPVVVGNRIPAGKIDECLDLMCAATDSNVYATDGRRIFSCAGMPLGLFGEEEIEDHSYRSLCKAANDLLSDYNNNRKREIALKATYKVDAIEHRITQCVSVLPHKPQPLCTNLEKLTAATSTLIYQ
jgi:hypothetical protein